MGKDVIIALDFPSGEECFHFLDKFTRAERKPFVKVGMELFYAEGPEIVRELKRRGLPVFLDLKLHDIPNTVKGGMRSLSSLGVDMANVHAAGTKEMMRAAREGLIREDGTRPLLIAVTVLTSISEEKLKKEMLVDMPLGDAAAAFAKNACEAGLDGVVCSPLEAEKVHRECGKDFLTITPGIRFSEDGRDDQARVTTPARAKELGSDYIVVGRSITASKDPVAAYDRAVRDFVD